MPPQPVNKPPFLVFESFMFGSRFLWRHAKFFTILSFLPFAVTLATLVAVRLAGANLTIFWLPIVQMPSNFVLGLQCALILRFIVLHEYPLIEDGPERAARNRAVSQAAMVYAAITYFITGAYAVLVKQRAFLMAEPEAAAPYAPLALAVMVLMIWATRWFWLHVPVALEWPVKGFYDRIGRWPGSLRILGLFIICSLVMNLFAGFTRAMLAAIGGKNPSGLITAIDDVLVAVATILLSLLFTCCTAAAVKMMAGVKIKDIEA